MIYEISMIYGNGGEHAIHACVDILVEHTDGMRMRGWNVQDICRNVQNINIKSGHDYHLEVSVCETQRTADDSVVSMPTRLTNDAIR